MADLAAEVINMERLGEGDETRYGSPPSFADGAAAYLPTVNPNTLFSIVSALGLMQSIHAGFIKVVETEHEYIHY